jgi:hypothetical protein
VNGIRDSEKGYEISITGTPIKTADFAWDVIANYSTFEERLTDIYPGITSLNTFLKVGDRTDKLYGSAFVHAPDGQIINSGGVPIKFLVRNLNTLEILILILYSV